MEKKSVCGGGVWVKKKRRGKKREGENIDNNRCFCFVLYLQSVKKE